MNILVTGANGMLGSEVVAAARRRDHAVASRDRTALDVTDSEAVARAIGATAPSVVINCAAFTAVDACEAEPGRAFAINADAVASLALACTAVGSRLVHVSTDYVFDGTKNGPYVESDVPHPQSVYGASKLAGEQAVLELGPTGLVARTAWMFGPRGANIVQTVLSMKDSKASLRFVNDQRGSPTSAIDLAEFLIVAIEREVSGIVHATNAGDVTWYEFVREILRQCGDDPTRVEAITTADLDPPRPALRPTNSVLESERLDQLGLPRMRRYEDALAAVLANIRP